MKLPFLCGTAGRQANVEGRMLFFPGIDGRAELQAPPSPVVCSPKSSYPPGALVPLSQTHLQEARELFLHQLFELSVVEFVRVGLLD